MASHTSDFRRIVPEPITEGYPVLGGWLHSLVFPSKVDIGVGDKILVLGRVPPEELWQVLQIRVWDESALAAKGWQG